MNLQNGEYIIRCNLADLSSLWFISGPTPNDQTGQSHAIAMSIIRVGGGERIKERDLPEECFVRLINNNNGTISLRQSATNRYAAFDYCQTWGIENLHEAKISFVFGSTGNGREFQLIAPSGVANGVAIRSMHNNHYVTVDMGLGRPHYLYPNCEFQNISANGLFRFELRFGYF